jgi:two-component system phosphate regulon response regulator PhoB
MAKAKVLIIEDDRSLAEVVAYNLKQAGFEVLMAHDGQDGLVKAQARLPDVIILDLMLPVIDGLDVCRRLRANPITRDMLIVMLTARAEEADELVGFSLGADDYVTKPFSVKVLIERIKALHRRRIVPTTEENAQFVSLQGITVDVLRHRATADESVLALTLSEFRLLDTLIRQPGRVFQRHELIDMLGQDPDVMQRTIDVHIRGLRAKLGERAGVIETVRGVGYRFRDET